MRGNDVAPSEVMNFIQNTPAIEPCSTIIEKKSASHTGRPSLRPAPPPVPCALGGIGFVEGGARGSTDPTPEAPEAWWLPSWESPDPA
eukprot:16438482-Heterocapsa_arctica.AAC.1